MDCFVAKVVKELVGNSEDSMEPKKCTQEYWKDLFETHFTVNSMESDDLLFIVPLEKDEPVSTSKVLIKRMVNGKMKPSTKDPIDWITSFYINLMSRLNCWVRLSVCERDVSMASGRRVVWQQYRKVYAEPTNGDVHGGSNKKSFSCSLPLLFFSLNEGGDYFKMRMGQSLCVELFVYWSNEEGVESHRFNTLDGTDVDEEYKAITYPYMPIFQGAVDGSSLEAVHTEKTSIFSSFSSQRVSMKGPAGGIASVQVKRALDANASSKAAGIKNKLKNGLKRFVNEDSENAKLKADECIECRLSFISYHWKLLVKMCFDHFKGSPDKLLLN